MKLTIVYMSTYEGPRNIKYFINKSTGLQYLYMKRMLVVGDWCWDEVETED